MYKQGLGDNIVAIFFFDVLAIFLQHSHQKCLHGCSSVPGKNSHGVEGMYSWLAHREWLLHFCKDTSGTHRHHYHSCHRHRYHHRQHKSRSHHEVCQTSDHHAQHCSQLCRGWKHSQQKHVLVTVKISSVTSS